MSPPAPHPDVIRATFRWLAHQGHGVSEIRIIRPPRGVIGIGFFAEEDAFVEACVGGNAAANVYVGIQPRPHRFLALAPNVVRPLKAGATNEDIAVLTATVIDIDPIRPKDTASTDAELAEAMAAAEDTAAWCVSEGLVRPRLMMSGNGAHLWFALPPTTLDGPSRVRLQAGLKAFEADIRERLGRPAAHVDSIHDLARIIKVIGTVSHKGLGEADRPHRVSLPRAGQARAEDAVLLARLDAPPEAPLFAPDEPPAPRTRVSLPLVADALPKARTKARRTADGGYDWAHPVTMCTPVARLWNEGHPDRSLAIFNMVRFFAHLGLGLEEITDLILEYDRRGLGKLTGRDGSGYVRKAYEKVIATAREDGAIAPPCHALQKLSYCAVNRVPGARCDLEEEAAPAVQATTKALRSDERPPQPTRLTFHGEIYEHAHGYACRTQHGDLKRISSFKLKITARIANDAGETIVADAYTDQGTVVRDVRLPLSAFHSRRDLLRCLASADLQWTGNDEHVQGLLRLLAQSSRRLTYRATLKTQR